MWLKSNLFTFGVLSSVISTSAGSEVQIFKSTLRPTTTKQNVEVGLILDKTSMMSTSIMTLTNGFTFCVRFNYRVLGWDSKLVSLGCTNEFNVDCIWIPAGYDLTFVGIGNFNWILKKSDDSKGLKTDDFLVWTTNQWHQICLTFDTTSSVVSFIKVMR